ncbi:MAG: hypothetical protein DMD85_12075 [Candidatus Rokuibacteriota bacterium]|nr:MAG: hypothetical protein DMD85_12075 [Candidatus Rokubacteria bacterium]
MPLDGFTLLSRPLEICAIAGAVPKTSAASVAVVIAPYRCLMLFPLPGCGLAAAKDGLQPRCQLRAHRIVELLPARRAWRFYNARGAPSSRAMTVRWIWFVPS